MKRVLLLGGSGRLGTAIRASWTDCTFDAPTHAELALEKTEELGERLAQTRPDLVVNAAAFHDVDRCEFEPERAFAVNAFAVGRAARLASESGAAFLTMSTDYVFDGAAELAYDESAPTHPLSLYGMSKVVGEYLAARAGSKLFVVRTCGLYGPHASSRESFIDRVLSLSPASQPMKVVADVVVSPTFAGDLAVALRRLVETREYGLYHAVNEGAVSWYDFARETLAQARRGGALEPIRSDEWKAAASRPKFSALENAKLTRLGIALPSWRAGIASYLGLQVR